MRCENAHLLISKDLDAELAADERARLDEHLARCPDCARYQARARTLQPTLTAGRQPVDDGEWNRILAQAQGRVLGATLRAARDAKRHRLRAWAASSAAALLAVALVLSLVARAPRPAPPAEPPGLTARNPGAVPGLVQPTSLTALDEQRRAYAELKAYFGATLRWLVQDGEQMELGLSADPAQRAAAHPTPTAETFAFRLVRARGDAVKLLSAPTLMIQPGVDAAFALAPTEDGDDKRFRFHCAVQSAPGPAFWVRVRVEFLDDDRGAPVALAGLVPVGDRHPVLVASSRVGDRVFALYLVNAPAPPRNETRSETSA